MSKQKEIRNDREDAIDYTLNYNHEFLGITSTRIPYTCPRCNGNGTGTGEHPLLVAGTRTICWPCRGSGVVWG